MGIYFGGCDQVLNKLREAEGVAWAYYSKNGEEDGAMFWVASDEGETFFALMRSTK